MRSTTTAVLQLRIDRLSKANDRNLAKMLDLESQMNQAIADGFLDQAYSLLQSIKMTKKNIEDSVAEMNQMVIELIINESEEVI